MAGYLFHDYNRDHVIYVSDNVDAPSKVSVLCEHIRGINWKSRRCLFIIFLLIALALILIFTVIINEIISCDNYFSTNYYVHEDKLSWFDA